MEAIREALQIAHAQYLVYSQYRGKNPYPPGALAEILLRHHVDLVREWDRNAASRQPMLESIQNGTPYG